MVLVGDDKITFEDMKYAFRRFDVNDNGKISLQEFIETLENHGVSRNGIVDIGKQV